VLCFDGVYENAYFVPLWCLTTVRFDMTYDTPNSGPGVDDDIGT
jgi:hypothetical protein